MVADQPENLIIKQSVACSAMFSEGQGATAVLFKETEGPRREIGWEEESSTNEVSHGCSSHSSVASQKLQVADHCHAFPDMTVSSAIIILQIQTTVVWHIDATLLSHSSFCHSPA